MLQLHSMNFETVPFSRFGVRRWGGGQPAITFLSDSAATTGLSALGGGQADSIRLIRFRRNHGTVGIVLGGKPAITF